jgi:hypothetical protein
MTARYRLTLEGDDDREDPTLEEIVAAVDGLSPEHGCGFLILECDGRDYVQVAGGGEAHTLEWREHPRGTFRHWVAGRTGPPSTEQVGIPTNCAPVNVFEHERLGADEVKAILTAFLQRKPRPTNYAWREITAQFH